MSSKHDGVGDPTPAAVLGDGPVGAWRHWLRTAGGETGALIADLDWGATALGPLEDWPASLRTLAASCLASPFPTVLYAGLGFQVLYNDATIPLLRADAHPAALGRPGSEAWPSSWDALRPRFERVVAERRPITVFDEYFPLDRDVPRQEFYFTWGFAPALGDAGEVLGVTVVFAETTRPVLVQRRLRTLLAQADIEGDDAADLLEHAVSTLATDARDVALAAAYTVVGEPASGGCVSAATPVPARWADAAAALASGAADTGEVQHLAEADGDVGGLHAYPIPAWGDAQPAFVLVVGHNAHRPWDDALAGFLSLYTAQTRALVAGAGQRASQQERLDALARLDEAKSEFLATISHELRTPLALLASPLDQALAALDSGADPREPLWLARRQVARLIRMVDALLDFSRMEAGRLAPALADLDIGGLTRALASAFTHAMEDAGLDFIVDVPDLARTANLDHDMYERMVLNLLTNALKYTPSGSVTLTVADEGDTFAVAVSDTGIGIDPADQSRIFERFRQLPVHPEARSAEGAGIGLALVRQLADLLGGSVSVSSVPGAGSTFTLRLPWRAPQSPADTTGTAAAADRSITRRDAASFLSEIDSWRVGSGVATARETGLPRLLVVEDNPDMRTWLADSLADEYDVETAPNGLVALRRIRARMPHVVLTDDTMPGLDGRGLVREIRRDPDLTHLPVLILSAHAGDAAVSRGLTSGADDYLPKPFSLEELRARLAAHRLLADARSGEAALRRSMAATFPDPLTIASVDGLILEVNEAFTRMLGWTLSDGPLTPPYPWWPDSATHPDAYQRVAAAHHAIVAGTPMAGEYLLRHRDGSPVWAAFWGAVIGGDERQVVVKRLTDVTRERLSRERRAAAARVVAEFKAASDLAELLGAAVDGFGVLFDGDATLLALPGARGETTFTALGPVAMADLDAGVRAELEGPGPSTPPGQPVAGLLLAAWGEDQASRTWVRFRRPRPVLADELIVGDLLTSSLDLAIRRITDAETSAERARNLEKAVDSHRFVGQAVGVLIERHRLTSAQAFERLRTASQRQNRKLRDVAFDVIETGVDP